MKRKGDEFGHRKGALGKHDDGVKLDRNYDPWNPKVLSDDLNAAADAAAKYSRNDDAGLRNKLPDEATAKPRDIYSDVCKNSLDDDAGGSRPGPIKYGVD